MNTIGRVPVGMVFDEFKQVVGRKIMLLHNDGSGGISYSDSLCPFPKLLQIALLPHRRRVSPDELGTRCVVLNKSDSLGETVTVLIFSVSPAVQPIVEVDHRELVLLQQQLKIIVEGRIGYRSMS